MRVLWCRARRAALACCLLAAGESALTAQMLPATVPSSLEDTDAGVRAARLELASRPSVTAHCRLAEIYFEHGVLDAALAHFLSASRLAPNYSPAHAGQARVWRDWHYLDLALAAAHRAVFFDRASASAHSTLGTVLLALGETTAARHEFRIAHAAAPLDAAIVNNACVVELQDGAYQNAVSACELAVTLDSRLSQASTNLGRAYGLTGDFARAHAAFVRGGTRAEAAYNLGLTYMSAERFDDARQAFEAALLGDPSSASARARLRQLQVMRGAREQ